MADNFTLNAGSGGQTLATDQAAGGEHYQQVKLVDGTADATTVIASGGGVEAGALRVTIASDSTGLLSIDDNGGSITVDGTVTANLSATDNAVLDTIDAVLDTINAKLVTGTVIGDVNLGATDNAVLDAIAASVAGTLTVDLGANNDVTVTSGTITANLSATDNAVLDTIDAVLDTINAKLVTGTVIGDVNLGATDNAVLDAIQAACETIDNSVFADDAAFSLTSSSVNMAGAVRDDTLSALAAVEGDAVPLRVGSTGALHVTGAGGGTQYTVDDAGPTVVTMAGVVRDDSLTTLTEVDGDATLLRVGSTGALHVTGGGGGTEYTEDVATANPIVGTATMMERDDALSALTPIAGDWASLRCDANGALWTAVNNTVTVDGSGVTQPVSGTVTANLSATDNAVLDTIDAVLDTVNAKLVTGTVIGDVNLGATDNAVLDSIVTNTTGLAGTVAGSELQVDLVSANVTNAGTFAVQLAAGAAAIGKAEDAASANADVGVPAMARRTATPADTSGADLDYEMLQMDNGRLWTSTTIDAALPAGTNAIGKLAANSGVDIGDVDVLTLPNVTLAAGTNTNEVVGDVAHDAAAAGNPVSVAARAAATVEGLTQVAGADASFVTADLNGCLVTRNGTTLEELVSERVSNTNGTSTAMTGAFAAGGAGIHAYVTAVTIHNSHATTMGYVDLRDGSAGSVLWTLPAPATGGTTHNFDPPLKFAANTAVAYDVSAAITTVYISINGFFAQG